MPIDIGTTSASDVPTNELRLYILRRLDDCRCPSCYRARANFARRHDSPEIQQRSLVALLEHGAPELIERIAVRLTDNGLLTA